MQLFKNCKFVKLLSGSFSLVGDRIDLEEKPCTSQPIPISPLVSRFLGAGAIAMKSGRAADAGHHGSGGFIG